MNFGDAVTTALPWIVNLATGNVPGLVAMAAKAVGGALGTEVEAKADSIAKAIAGATPEQQAALLAANNQLAIRMRELGVQEATDLAKADAEIIAAVNATMQAEANNSDKEAWYQKAWRPFNGFVVGGASFVTVCGVLWLSYTAIQSKDMAAIGVIPAIVTSIAMVLAIPGAAVGITAWHRGVLKRMQAQAGIASAPTQQAEE